MRNAKMKMMMYYKMIEMIQNYGFKTVFLMIFIFNMNFILLYIVANITKIMTKNNELNFILENAPINYLYKNRKENHKKGDKDFYEIDYYNIKPL